MPSNAKENSRRHRQDTDEIDDTRHCEYSPSRFLSSAADVCVTRSRTSQSRSVECFGV